VVAWWYWAGLGLAGPVGPAGLWTISPNITYISKRRNTKAHAALQLGMDWKPSLGHSKKDAEGPGACKSILGEAYSRCGLCAQIEVEVAD
jgi:hypothetical protein